MAATPRPPRLQTHEDWPTDGSDTPAYIRGYNAGWDAALADSGAEERLRAAQLVSRYWLDAIMASAELRGSGMSHPLAMVRAAMDGETDPTQLGINEDRHDEFRAALSGGSVDEETG